MKPLAIVVLALALSSCASEGQFRSSTSVNGQSFSSFDMTDPHFYMESDAPPGGPPVAAPPAMSRFGIDSYCGYCRTHY
jgi:hypothetical protein